jgi:hypothetical protein
MTKGSAVIIPGRRCPNITYVLSQGYQDEWW